MEGTGVREYAETPGNRGVYMLRRAVNGQAAFVMFTWDSLDAVKAFAGEDYETAVFYPEDDRFLVERDEHLSLIHISEPTRLRRISYAVFCLKKKKKNK